MKKITLLFLSLIFAFHALASVEIDGIIYNLNSDNKSASVTGYSYNVFKGEVVIVIPSSIEYNGVDYCVNRIEHDSFKDYWGLTSITSITIPNSVTYIGQNAFSGCPALTSITIPNSVTYIGDAAFANCSSLTSITIPDSVNYIGSSAFYSCSGLTSIKVESGNIHYDSRNNCNAIIETETNTLLFGCRNTIIPSSVVTIGLKAFENCTGLTSITIPRNATSINNSAFKNCTGLTSITIPRSVTSIGGYAFDGCKIRNIFVEGITPPHVSTNTFSDVMSHHTIIYIPAGSWDAYAFESNWYVFNTIRELAIKENQVSEQQTYMLMNTNNFSYSVFDPVNNVVGIINSFNNINEDNPNHCWQLLEAAGNHYMYNLGAKRFLVKANNEIGLALSNKPEAIDFQDGDDGIILGGDSSKRWALVRNGSTFANQQIITGIDDLISSSTPTDNGFMYNLNGQRTVKLQKGVNIINGRKVLVK